MSNAFYETSKAIANDFLQSVVFIDDRAFVKEEGRNEHSFDTVNITRAFAKSQKVCGVYQPEVLEDIENLAQLAKKADVTILDWRIDIKSEAAEAPNSEEDADDIDPRGPHTCKIIQTILTDPNTGKGSLKLLLIYTGETNLPGIALEVFKYLQKEKIENLQIDGCSVFTENIKILVLAKKGGKDQFKHNPELKSQIVGYDELPDFILEEFTKMTTGLLTNFALKCLTSVRANSFQLINLFGKKLDAAYLGHRALLPNNKDAEDQLIELIKDSFGDLLYYHNAGELVNEDAVKVWIESTFKTRNTQFKNSQDKLFKNDKGIDITATYLIDSKLAESLLISEETDVEARFEKVFKPRNLKEIQPKDKSEFLKLIQLNSTSLFTEDKDFQELDKRFAKLSHHKNLLRPASYSPKLWQGTIMKGVESEQYWICIQQKCDSVRLKPNEERRFLFLPLAVKAGSNDKFHFVTPNNVKLRLSTKSYGLRTIKFDPDSSGFVVAEKQGDMYLFYPSYSKKAKPLVEQEAFEWIFDLKDMHSQRVINDYAREISRVGLDESEWLRRWAT